jgi:hypothetical protein
VNRPGAGTDRLLGSMRIQLALVTTLLACGGSEPPVARDSAPPPPRAALDAGAPPVPAASDAAVPAERVQSALGDATLSTLRSTGNLEGYLLITEEFVPADAQGRWDELHMGGYRLRTRAHHGDAHRFDRATADRLLDVLLRDDSYDLVTARRCARDHLVGLRFLEASGHVDVVLSFTCNQVQIVGPDPASGATPSWAGWLQPPAREAVLAIVRTIFGDRVSGW